MKTGTITIFESFIKKSGHICDYTPIDDTFTTNNLLYNILSSCNC